MTLEPLTLPLEIQWLPRYICPCGGHHQMIPRTGHPLDGILRLDCPDCHRSFYLRGRQRLFDRGVEFEMREVDPGDP